MHGQVKITICPTAKAYGYDRETLSDHDKMLHDLAISDDYSRTLNRKHNATVIPSTDLHLNPRNYDGDPE